jgi:ABC-2 type transport system ATP-binding protein
VKVVSPQADALATLIRQRGGAVNTEGPETLMVTGLDCRGVGELAAGAALTLYELSPQEASLEEAFMEMTRDSAEFIGEAHASEGGRP